MPPAKTKRRAKKKYEGGNHGPFKPEVDPVAVANKRWLTIEEAAWYAGGVSVMQIRRWIDRGLLRKAKLNDAKSGRIWIDKNKLDELMESLEVE